MICRKCKQALPLDQFSWANKAEGKRQTRCKQCFIDYTNVIDAANRDFLIQYLLAHPCVDCDEDDIEVLEFDHIVSEGPGARKVWGWIRGSRKRLIQEVEKCEVRCANCHTRRTRKQFGYRDRT